MIIDLLSMSYGIPPEERLVTRGTGFKALPFKARIYYLSTKSPYIKKPRIVLSSEIIPYLSARRIKHGSILYVDYSRPPILLLYLVEELERRPKGSESYARYWILTYKYSYKEKSFRKGLPVIDFSTASYLILTSDKFNYKHGDTLHVILREAVKIGEETGRERKYVEPIVIAPIMS